MQECFFCMFRSLPVEVLHTVLLGPYKYLLGKTMQSLRPPQKKEILAWIASFNYSGFTGCMSSNVTQYSQSFVGRDFKVGLKWPPSSWRTNCHHLSWSCGLLLLMYICYKQYRMDTLIDKRTALLPCAHSWPWKNTETTCCIFGEFCGQHSARDQMRVTHWTHNLQAQC